MAYQQLRAKPKPLNRLYCELHINYKVFYTKFNTSLNNDWNATCSKSVFYVNIYLNLLKFAHFCACG